MSSAELLLVLVASTVGAFVKSVTGMGYPLIAIPMLALFMGVETAVAVIAIPNTIANGLLNFGVRHEHPHTRDLPVLVVTAIVGALAGTFVLVEAPEEPLLLALAVTVFFFVLQRLRNPTLRLEAATTRRWAPLAGMLAGFSHGAVGVSGPIVAMWLHGYRLPKDAYVFALTALFLVAGGTQLVVLLASGRMDADRAIAAGVALVATLCMIPIGTRVRERIPGATFERLILGVLVLSGLSLIGRAIG